MSKQMKKRLIYILIAIVASSVHGFAQNKIHSTVSVEKNYEGEVLKASKSNIYLPVADSLFNFKLQFDYPTFYRPYKDLYEFSPVLSADFNFPGKVIYPKFYADLMLAYPWNPYAELVFSPSFGKGSSMEIHLKHNSLWCDDISIGNRMTNALSLGYSYKWKRGVINAGVQLSDGAYRLEGAHGYSWMNAYVNGRSANIDRDAFYYDFSVAFKGLYGRNGGMFDYSMKSLSEQGISMNLSFGATLKEFHRLYINIEDETVFSAIPSSSAMMGYLSLSPIYNLSLGRWYLKVGCAFSMPYSADTERLPFKKLQIFPKVDLSFEAVKDLLWVSASVEGRSRMHSFYEMTSTNPYLDNSVAAMNALSAEVTPIDAALKLRGVLAERFSYSVYAGAAQRINILSFGHDGTLQVPLLADSWGGYTGLFASWNSKSLYAWADARYNYFSNDAVLAVPPVDVRAGVEYNIRKRIFFAADLCYHSSSKMSGNGETESLPGFVNLGLKISYSINPDMTVYIKGTNLLNDKIYYFGGIREPGVSVAAGIYFNF